MKKYFTVTYKHSEAIYCANIVHAETVEAVKACYSKYEQVNIRESEQYEVDAARRKGMPIVEIENQEDVAEKERRKMKKISIDNGHTYCTPEEALEQISMDVLAVYMDDDARKLVHYRLAPCSEVEFLTAYLEIAPYDLVIGGEKNIPGNA